MSISNARTALVTGSSRGIGRACALALAKAGAKVVLHGAAASPALAEAAALAGGNAVCEVADFSRLDEVDALAKRVQPDILVLNCSVQSYTSLENYSDEEFFRQMTVNVSANIHLLRAVLPGMRQRKWGRIIFISSMNAAFPVGRLALYGATKAAMENIISSAAREEAKYGITANTVIPGVIATDRNVKALSDEAFAAGLLSQIPAGRFGTPEDCAVPVLMLASEEAAYISGARIPVAGGWKI